MIEDMSLSPDGSALAVLAGSYSDRFNAGTLVTYNLSAGPGKIWQPSGNGLSGGQRGSSLSWEANGRTLGFVHDGFRLLDTAAPGNNLLTASRPAVPSNQPPSPFWRQAMVTPDGQTVLEVMQIDNPRAAPQLEAFSARTGKLERVMHEPVISNTGDLYEQVQWSSPSGDVLLISGEGGSVPRLPYPGFSMSSLGVLANGHYSALPWSAGTYLAAW
ncbi:MAG TPA: hypothetical protein VGH27_32510 [Streptosporangiaceae bacterium]|jgi:hypothetical protein